MRIGSAQDPGYTAIGEAHEEYARIDHVRSKVRKDHVPFPVMHFSRCQLTISKAHWFPGSDIWRKQNSKASSRNSGLHLCQVW